MPHSPDHMHDGADSARSGMPTGQRPFKILGRTDNRQDMFVQRGDDIGPSMESHPTTHLSDTGFDTWKEGGYTTGKNSWKKNSDNAVVPDNAAIGGKKNG